jgi:hypothetical protein
MTYNAMRSLFATGLLGAGLALLAAAPVAAMGSLVGGDEIDNCSNEDGAFNDAAFVIATGPKPGERVESGFDVTGCSRTFESNVQWRLLARDGSVLASGNTSGGGVDGPGAFSFVIPYTVNVKQVGHLEVFEDDASDAEGFPPGRTVIPIILKP